MPVRALILALSALVLALAVSVMVYRDEMPESLRQVGPRMEVGRLLGDAALREVATYREVHTGQRLRFTVASRPKGLVDAAPTLRIVRELLGPGGTPREGPEASIAYTHSLADHGWFPLMAPAFPQDLDRLWVVRSIRQEEMRRGAQSIVAWRVDAIDPALPPEAETVTAWLSVRVPVFGLLGWKRLDEEWRYDGALEKP